MIPNAVISRLLRQLGLDGGPNQFRLSFFHWAAQPDMLDLVSLVCFGHHRSDWIPDINSRQGLLKHRRAVMENWACYLEAVADA